MDKVRRRLEGEREDAIRNLRDLGVTPQLEERPLRQGPSVVLDEGDAAQASERQDVSIMTRERIAARINVLTAALRRIAEGTYGICEDCGGPIEPARLAALPEATTCLRCQEKRERAAAAERAA
ncbi:MAG TPA: TraR/DksA C4-type zinc finger protein [Methylomirabilota bacterium]|nr:TraR/DksA C4-type zinc finger protein [Methylomirabilota bacterium]